MKRVRITEGGQITFPAAVRRRWGTSYVWTEDRGDHLVLRPAPDDLVAAVRGVFRNATPSDEARALQRADERSAEQRRDA